MDDQHSLTRESWEAARSSYAREWAGLCVKMGYLARDAWARVANAWPRKPDIPRDRLDYLERWGVHAARLMLAGMTAKNPEQAPHYFAQDEVQAWLVRRAKANAFWTRTGAIAAMIAMILAGLSWVMPLKPAAPSKPADKPALIDRQFSALAYMTMLASSSGPLLRGEPTRRSTGQIRSDPSGVAALLGRLPVSAYRCPTRFWV